MLDDLRVDRRTHPFLASAVVGGHYLGVRQWTTVDTTPYANRREDWKQAQFEWFLRALELGQSANWCTLLNSRGSTARLGRSSYTPYTELSKSMHKAYLTTYLWYVLYVKHADSTGIYNKTHTIQKIAQYPS